MLPKVEPKAQTQAKLSVGKVLALVLGGASDRQLEQARIDKAKYPQHQVTLREIGAAVKEDWKKSSLGKAFSSLVDKCRGKGRPPTGNTGV